MDYNVIINSTGGALIAALLGLGAVVVRIVGSP